MCWQSGFHCSCINVAVPVLLLVHHFEGVIGHVAGGVTAGLGVLLLGVLVGN